MLYVVIILLLACITAAAGAAAGPALETHSYQFVCILLLISVCLYTIGFRRHPLY
jgi:hypothetical protein